ncbi:hypothetical protein HaLaN_30417 [Haematococcus lacustris]|uniref:Uncharacterized protein n=1 Tax=Haematococcus lacustris TaxID=44745 RepID=A0A6A0AGM2_HAELA|nr:hypothetical protein HaLaN_30417 [Haematococcus lacustris]
MLSDLLPLFPLSPLTHTSPTPAAASVDTMRGEGRAVMAMMSEEENIVLGLETGADDYVVS